MANMYQNPLLNAPLGPDGLPIRVDPRAAQEHFEVSSSVGLSCGVWHAGGARGGWGKGAGLGWVRKAKALGVRLQCECRAACVLGNTTHSLPASLALAQQDFYEDVFEELAAHGELENLNVCDNFADHMVGNVYAKFRDEDAAARALTALQGRYYDGRPIIVEFSPVTDFREATCRQYEENTCNRGGYCNFMHLKPISRELRKKLFGRYKRRERSRSPRCVMQLLRS